MRYEVGVHRVHRVPITDKRGQLQTSTAAISVVPKAKQFEVDL